MPNRAHVELCGHVGKEPEIKRSNSGKDYGKFSIAVNTGSKEKSVTSWYNITATGYTVEAARQLHKGDAASVIGRLEFCKTPDDKGPYLTVWADLIAVVPRGPQREMAQPEQATEAASNDCPF